MKKQLIIGIIVLLVCVGLSGCTSTKINEDYAIEYAKRCIDTALISPGSAEYGACTAIKLGEGTYEIKGTYNADIGDFEYYQVTGEEYKVTGYVDAQNENAVLKRMNYAVTCVVTDAEHHDCELIDIWYGDVGITWI